MLCKGQGKCVSGDLRGPRKQLMQSSPEDQCFLEGPPGWKQWQHKYPLGGLNPPPRSGPTLDNRSNVAVETLARQGVLYLRGMFKIVVAKLHLVPPSSFARACSPFDREGGHLFE